MPQITCPRCSRSIAEAQAAFCPFCGAALLTAQAQATPPEAAALLLKAARQSSNKKKLALLEKARQLYPDCLSVQEEWLFQGRLPTTAADALDYRRIKCYLLQPYLTPEDFTPGEGAQMRTELFEDPQLLRCTALSGAGDAYTARYLERLCREYIQVFLMGSSEYMPKLLGFRLERDPAKALAKPAAQMLRRMAADEQLPPKRRQLLTAAFRQAFHTECGGNMLWLDKLLEE